MLLMPCMPGWLHKQLASRTLVPDAAGKETLLGYYILFFTNST
jgi:hypothetical protein